MTHLPGSRGNRYRNPRFPTGEANLRLPFQAEQPQYNVHPMEYCARVTCPPNVVPNYNPQMRPPFPGPDSMTYSPPVLNHLDPLYSEQSTRFTIPPPIPSAQVYVPPYQTPQSTLHTWSSEQVPGNNCTSFPQNSVSSTAETWHNTVPFPEEVPKELIRPKLEQLVPILWHSKKEPKFEVDKIGENTYPPIFKDATDIRVKQEYTSPDNCEEKGNNTPSRRKSNSPLSRQRTPPLSNQIREPSSKQRSRTPTPRRRSKSPSSIRSSKTSSTRQSSRTPSSRRSRTPSKQRSRTPSRRRSRTPSRRRLKTPSRRRSRTPSRQRTRTPSRRRSRTPSRRRSRTPLRRRSRTPSRRRSRTPSRRRSRTASRRRSRTPSRQRSRTASRRRSRTPSRRRSRTPSRRRSRTPSRRRSRTPSSRLGSRSRSPLSRFSSKTHSSRCHSKTPPSRRRSKRALSRHRSKTPRSRRRSRTPLSRRKQRSRSLSCRRGRRSRDRSSNYDRSRRSYSLSRAQSSRSRKRSTSSRRTATKSDTRQSHSSDSDKGYSQTKKSYSRSPDFHNSKENLESPPANTTASQGPEDEASRSFSPAKTLSERQCVLEKYRMDYCANSAEMHRKLEEISRLKPEEIVELEKKVWTRTAPADLFYARENNSKVMRATQKLIHLCERFRIELLERAATVRSSRPAYEPPPRKNRMRLARHKSELCSSSESLSDESTTDEEDCTMEELERKRLHPHRLHPEMWYNDSGEMNDGPLCRCSAKARRYGIRHGIYAGESHLPKCEMDTNNADRLFHYRITISPPTNFLTKTPTIIKHDEHEFIFEGFSMFSHFPLDQLPTCKVIRFNIEYTILYIDEKLPENFTIRELDLFYEYLFHELLELVDLDFKAHGDSTGCSQFHFMPRFVRDLQDNGKEILSMNEVMQYLIQNSKPLIEEAMLNELLSMPQFKWQNFADEVKGMVVTYPGMKPCSVRVDQLDRDQQKIEEGKFPEIVHFGIRPPQLSYAGNPEYQKSWREYVKFRHLLANMPKPSFEDKRKLESKENKLQDMRTQSKMKRDVTVAVSASGFHRTGIMCDIIQHAMLIPVLVCHLRFHRSCNVLEKVIGYKFKNRFLLQLALTHPSYRENFGTNPDHARNSLTNCGIRQPEYGDRRIHYMNTRKRGINTLINIMSRFGKKTATESNITHNERLEFLGDAVVEFLTSIHLFHMFPDLEEGGLATYRAAIVQNQHLAVLAKTLNLEEFMLYAHGSDLCHDLELRHAMANCFEALMGALFLDGGIEVADKVFGETLFKDEANLLDIWVNYPPHPLQEQEPLGDRKWIPSFELLQNLTKFEDSIGVEFKHIRLLARAFTDRSIGYTNLTLGSNQRLEFLGDTVLQLIASEYLYKYFPEHHEGHLSLLRSSLVNNRTQAVVCDDLGMIAYALYSNPKVELKTKDRADLLEAFLGALYVDKGLDFCHTFCDVCFFPRLQDFIMNQDWNDPKSKLQQCCLTLRTMEGGEPDIPVYKVIECKGPTNTRVYTVAVYFRGARLAKASGHSIQQAEMNAAKNALEKSQDLFPQLDHQKRVIAKSLWRQQRWPSNSDSRSRSSPDREMPSTSRDRSKSSSHSIKGKMSSRDRRKGKSSRHKKSASKEPVPSSSRSSIKNKKSIPDKNGKDTIDTISPPSCKNKMKKIDINCGGNVDSNHNNDDNDDHNNDDDDDDHDNDDDDDDDDDDGDDDDDDNDDVSSDDDIYGK